MPHQQDQSPASNTGNASSPIDRLENLASIKRGPPGPLLVTSLLLPVITFLDRVALGIGTILDVFIVPVRAVINGVGHLMLSILLGAADIVAAGAGTSAESLRVGILTALGPLTFPIGVGTILLTAYLMEAYLSQEPTSDFIPFTFTDFPFVGAEEDA